VWINNWDSRGWVERHTLGLPALDGLPLGAAALGDLDNDGDLDVLAHTGAPKPGRGVPLPLVVLLNDGSGSLAGYRQGPEASPGAALALGDLDADGDLDAVAGTGQGAVVWINQGGVQAGSPGVFVLGGKFAGGELSAVFLADFNRDGALDALVAGAQEAVLWWNDGWGGFQPFGAPLTYTSRHALAAGDFNGDGEPDVFAATQAGSYTLWLSQGDGTFQENSGR
jgi:hypothetical protein